MDDDDLVPSIKSNQDLDVVEEQAEDEEPEEVAKPKAKAAAAFDPNFDLSKVKVLDTNYMDKLGEEEEMPKKKKKKRRLTKQERLELKKKKLIAETKIKMRDHLARELEYSKKTVAKFQDDWEELIKSIKIVEMKQDLQEWTHKVNRVIEMKDSMVKNMLTDMDHTMELANKSHAQFVQVLNFYHGVHSSCTQIIKNCYDSQAHDMIYNLHMDLQNQHEHLEEQKLNFEKKLHALSMKAEYIMLKDKEVFDKKKDFVMDENIVERYEVRDKIAKQMRQLQKSLCDFIDDLKNTIEPDKYERYNNLMEKHKVFLEDRAKLDKTEMLKLMEYQQCQQNLLKLEIKMSKKLNNLQQEYLYFLEVRNLRLKEMNAASKFTYQQIKAVTVGSHELQKKFKKVQRHGELILSLAARCRKMQTQDEKVYFEMIDKTYFNEAKDEMVRYQEFLEGPQCAVDKYGDGRAFYPLKRPELFDLDVVKNIFKIRTLELKCHLDLTDEELKAHIDLFENFWRRQALVEAEVILLRQEKQRLLKENNKYTEFIKSLGYTDDMSKLREFIKVEQVHPGSVEKCHSSVSRSSVTPVFLDFPEFFGE